MCLETKLNTSECPVRIPFPILSKISRPLIKKTIIIIIIIIIIIKRERKVEERILEEIEISFGYRIKCKE
jgi:hypothetical protein